MNTENTNRTHRDLRAVIAAEKEEPRYLPVVGYHDNDRPTLELPAFRDQEAA